MSANEMRPCSVSSLCPNREDNPDLLPRQSVLMHNHDMRRLLAETLAPGLVTLDPEQSHHARNVLRLSIGDRVELFDRSSRCGVGTIATLEPALTLNVEVVTDQPAARQIVVASAVPKGDRADWMVEKLSEIGVGAWVPLKTERSVVHPEGRSKYDRWRRIAEESAKQSRRPGVMEVRELTSLSDFSRLIDPKHALVLSTIETQPISSVLTSLQSVTLLIGPEGGWTDAEESRLRSLGLTPVALTRTILRVETAAVVAAGIVASFEAP
jgi:16S rRNA (uracil1498-N3)-methyltransferase